MKTNKGQEEIVGFSLIIIIVAVVILVFLVLMISTKEESEIESYEIQSFLQAVLQHTTECADNNGYKSVQRLIMACGDGKFCENNERDSCRVLEETLREITSESWSIGKYKGYKLEVEIEGDDLIEPIEEGNLSSSYKGAVNEFSRRGISTRISLRVYT